MAHFQAGIQGNRGPATRLGTSKSGIYAFARGWDGGVYVSLWESEGEDYIKIAVGPHHNTSQHTILVGKVKDIVKYPKTYAIEVLTRLTQPAE